MTEPDFIVTADLADRYGDAVRSCETQFRRFGGRSRFSGRIATVRCLDDNVLVRELLSQPADGRVLVVDGGASLHRALMGDDMANLAAGNGWAGIVIHGVVRDSVALAGIDIGIKALGTNPRKSLKQREGVIGSVLEFGGVSFIPGEMLVSDEDGIVVIEG